jgi:hypothetical protein
LRYVCALFTFQEKSEFIFLIRRNDFQKSRP